MDIYHMVNTLISILLLMDILLLLSNSKLFDQGSYAEMDRINGRMYKNLPYESYNMIILDQSMGDDGERNIQLVGEEGREVVTGIYKGISDLP